MAVNAYLLITLNDGAFLKSEHAQALGSDFKDPFPGRPPLGPGKILFPILSYSLGASNPVTVGSRTGVSAGKPEFGDLAVMRFLDVATTTFFADVAAGRAFKFVDVLLAKPTGDTESTFAGFGLGKVLLTSIQWSGSNEQPSESVSFAYGQIWTAYRVQSAEGTGFGPWAVKGWDRTKNGPL